MKKRYPKLIQGYDLVGQEDLGRTLHDLTPELLWFQDECAKEGVHIPFFFHAGECLGDGDETDHNLFDAILFGTRRIGHAFSLYKHPLLIDMVKEKKILVESCPISNEVLRYTASIMTHPLPALISRGVAGSHCNHDQALLCKGT
jgi:adenosine deaminase CECR1